MCYGWDGLHPLLSLWNKGLLKKRKSKKLDAIMGQPKAHCFLKDWSEFSEYTKDKKKKKNAAI